MVELVQPGGTGIEGVSLPEARRARTAVQDHLSGAPVVWECAWALQSDPGKGAMTAAPLTEQAF